jgi:NADPH-dependent curcumin reductase CurA
VYFDNTGGAVTAAVFALLRQDARVALCGLVAEYGDEAARGPNMKYVLARQALVKGFSVRRNLQRMPEYRAQAAAWIRSGELKYREDITQGIEHTAAAFRGMLEGRNLGKALVQVGTDPTRV